MFKRTVLISSVLLSLSACNNDDNKTTATPVVEKPMVTGHRGASALRPEHTLEAYQKAIDDGADVIEPDLVPTKDGHLVARHESLIGIVDAENKPVFDGSTTNVSTRPEFADRIKTKEIDGVIYKGWFTEDFTLAELKTLRARERIPNIRPENTVYNDKFEVPTLVEVIQLAENHYKKTGKIIGLYPETKHPTYFKSIGLPLDTPLMDTLAKYSYSSSIANVYIQSFEVQNLKDIRARLTAKKELKNAKIVQLFDYWNGAKGTWHQPYDYIASKNPTTYRDMLDPNGIKEVAKYADIISPYKEWLIPRVNGYLGKPTMIIDQAHQLGMKVHTWTMRPENTFLPTDMKSSIDPLKSIERNPAGSVAEIQTYLNAGLDGFFTDDPAVGRKAVDTFVKK